MGVFSPYRLLCIRAVAVWLIFQSLHTASAAAEAAREDGFRLLLTDEELRFGSIVLYVENDKFFAGTDRHYTQGLKLSYLSRNLSRELSEAPKWLRAAAKLSDHFLGHDADAAHKIAFSFGHNIYTPQDTSTPSLVASDRPYAAWLYLAAAVHTQSASHLDSVEMQLGIVGPSALGRQVQNSWHRFIDVDEAQGWANQLSNEIGLVLSAERRWRFSLIHASSAAATSGYGLDLIPHVGVTIGNVFTHASGGLSVRSGWRLPKDFGSSLIRPGGDSSSHSNDDTRGSAFYVFGAAEVRLVGRNIFLDGNTWKDSHSVDRRELVGDLTAGLAVRLRNMRLSYAQVYRTREFYGQQNRDVFGSVSATWLY